MSKLETLIQKFTNDKSWNTEEQNGSRRFDSKIEWIEKMFMSYSQKFKINLDDLVDDFESKRTYSWPNYYQKCNFPDIVDIPDNLIFEDIEDFKSKKMKFKCPNCHNIFTDPQECEHRIKEDGICDWAAYGLLKSPHVVIIKSHSLIPVTVLEPVFRENKQGLS